MKNLIKEIIINQYFNKNNMAKQVTEYTTTTMDTGSNNNGTYPTSFEKAVSNDNYANGMGISMPSALRPFENIPGLEQSDQYMLKQREMARFNSLKPALGNPTINNAGVVLDTFGGTFGEAQKAPAKPNVQGGANY